MEIIVTIALAILVISVIYLLGVCLRQQEHIEDLERERDGLIDSLSTFHSFNNGELE
jgi:hypothetical protein